MRNAWRALFNRSLHRRIPPIQAGARIPLVRVPTISNPSFSPPFSRHNIPAGFIIRHLSSELAVDHKDVDHGPLIEIFSSLRGPDDIKAELESTKIALDHETVNSVLRSLEESSDIAQRFFKWVSEKENGKLSSKSFNIMLRILGRAGQSDEFWDLINVMKRKGFGISRSTYLNVSQSFEERRMARDLEMLKEIYVSNSPENYVVRMCPRVCKIMRECKELDEDVRRKLAELALSLSPDLILAVLERLSSYPDKALWFFQWVEENSSFIINGTIYNVLARTLGREDFIEEFREVLRRLRSGSYVLERETYFVVSGRFCKRKMIKEAVELYEFAMGGEVKPTAQNFSFLLRKIVVSEDLDMGLISRTVRTFIEAGYAMKGSVFDGVLKSLASVDKLGECDKILKAMVDGGFVASVSTIDQVVTGLSDARRLDEACKFLVEMEDSGVNPSVKAWSSLVQRHSLSGETDKALSCFCTMVERKGGENAGCAFEVLVNAFYHKNKLEDACKFLAEMVHKRGLQPWHSTYKFLIEKLLSQGKLKEAIGLLGLMKSHGFPPFVAPFIDYLSKFGNGDDAMSFLTAMTVKKSPSTAVFLQLFDAFFDEGRHDAAQDLLSRSPKHIRAHADVLDLFYSRSPNETAIATAL